MIESLLDMMVEEKHIQKVASEYQTYVPHIDRWKIKRSHRMPGVGTTEDTNHRCTLDCRTRRWLDTIVPDRVYGCLFSGVVHVCKRTSDCHFHFTDSEGMKRCVLSGFKCGDSYSHSWAPHDLYDKKNTDSPEVMLEDKTLYNISERSDADAQRSDYNSKKGDNMVKDMKEGWIMNIMHEISQDEDTEKHNFKPPINGLYHSSVPTITRKRRVVDDTVIKTISVEDAIKDNKMGAYILDHYESIKNANCIVNKTTMTAKELFDIADLHSCTPLYSSNRKEFVPIKTFSGSATPIVSNATPIPSEVQSPFYGTIKTNQNAFAPIFDNLHSDHIIKTQHSPSSMTLGSPMRSVHSTPHSVVSDISAVTPDKLDMMYKMDRDKRKKEENSDPMKVFRDKVQLFPETRENLEDLALSTREVLFDFLWDNEKRSTIYQYKLMELKNTAEHKLESYIDSCLHCKIQDAHRTLKGVRKKSRRSKKTQISVSLFPSMFYMDSIYWTTLNSIEPPRENPTNIRINRYYENICMKLWRFFSYYGQCSELYKRIAYYKFVGGVLYTLCKEGLIVAKETIIEPDTYLQKHLPSMVELEWRPHPTLQNCGASSQGIYKTAPPKNQILLKGANISSGTKKTKQSHVRGTAGSLNRDSEHDPVYSGLSGTKVKSKFDIMHGNKENEQINSFTRTWMRNNRGKKAPKFKKEREPPLWMSLGAIKYKKSVDDTTAFVHMSSFGNDGRIYTNAIISDGKKFIAFQLEEISKTEKLLQGLKKCLEPEIRSRAQLFS